MAVESEFVHETVRNLAEKLGLPRFLDLFSDACEDLSPSLRLEKNGSADFFLLP